MAFQRQIYSLYRRCILIKSTPEDSRRPNLDVCINQIHLRCFRDFLGAVKDTKARETLTRKWNTAFFRLFTSLLSKICQYVIKQDYVTKITWFNREKIALFSGVSLVCMRGLCVESEGVEHGQFSGSCRECHSVLTLFVLLTGVGEFESFGRQWHHA